MIQELFGSTATATSTLISPETKSSIHNGAARGRDLLQQTPPSSSPLPPSSTTVTTTTTTTSSENLRCPRCDSSNTKFCYYNNYNLTQPRHFCKTCRRYWTKGGALRNVPIGGGCRKNKTISMSNSAAKSAANKMKTVAPELGRSPILGTGFEVEQELIPHSQILWGSPQNTHILQALLRASQNQNPNPNLNLNPCSISASGAMAVKEEGNNNLLGSQSQVVNEPLVCNGLMASQQRSLGYDCVGAQILPSLGLCSSSSYWSGQQQNNNGGIVLGEHHQIQNGVSGIQELYQKLRSSSSSSSNYCGENSSSVPVFLGNLASNNNSMNSSSSITNILEASNSVGAAAEFGYWNPTLTWPDLPTTNGAYP